MPSGDGTLLFSRRSVWSPTDPRCREYPTGTINHVKARPCIDPMFRASNGRRHHRLIAHLPVIWKTIRLAKQRAASFLAAWRFCTPDTSPTGIYHGLFFEKGCQDGADHQRVASDLCRLQQGCIFWNEKQMIPCLSQHGYKDTIIGLGEWKPYRLSTTHPYTSGIAVSPEAGV